LFIWFVWFVLFIWLNQTNQIDPINQINPMNQMNQKDQIDQTTRKTGLVSDVRATKLLACQAMLKSGPLFCCPTFQPRPAHWGMGTSARGVWNG
jgi:hypothetical protein